jgi:hypothetical protein
VSSAHRTDVFKGSHLGAVYYGPVAMCIKVAILANWLRIFVPTGTRNAFYWTLHVLIWTNVLYYTITTFTEVFRCWPREKIWNPWFEGGTCSVDVLGQNLATSVLNMSRDQKVGLSLLFVVGLGFVSSFNIIMITRLTARCLGHGPWVWCVQYTSSTYSTPTMLLIR